MADGSNILSAFGVLVKRAIAEGESCFASYVQLLYGYKVAGQPVSRYTQMRSSERWVYGPKQVENSCNLILKGPIRIFRPSANQLMVQLVG
jgi:hypothetical protein